MLRDSKKKGEMTPWNRYLSFQKVLRPLKKGLGSAVERKRPFDQLGGDVKHGGRIVPLKAGKVGLDTARKKTLSEGRE